MGSPSMNLVPVEVVRANGATAVSLARGEGEPALLQVANASPALQARAGKKVILGIRPEAVTDVDGADRHATQRGAGRLHERRSWSRRAPTPMSSRISAGAISSRACAPTRRCMPKSETVFAFNMDRATFFDPETEQRID